MSYHPKDVADFGTNHGYDLTSAKDRTEVAEEYIRSGGAPSGMAASTIEWHLEHFLKGERVGLYEPDGTTRSSDDQPAGKFVIKVDGEEIDHADTPAGATRARDTIIYGEIGTEQNTTIEPRS